MIPATGEMTERLKVHAWKACVRETVPRVRIPLSPPFHKTAASAAFFIINEVCDEAVLRAKQEAGYGRDGFSVRLQRQVLRDEGL